MAAFWPTKTAHPPLRKEAIARSLDGYRLVVNLSVTFRKALDDDAAEAAADEMAHAASAVLGDQISQGRVPLTTAELAETIRKRVSSAVNKVTELEVDAIKMLGGRPSGQHSSRVARASAPSPPATSVAPGRSPTPSDGALPVAERTSGSALAAPPRTLWLVALAHCAPGASTNEIETSLGLALRDSTAAVLLRVLMMADPVVVDRFALLDGRPPVPALRTEICACLAAGFLRVLLSNGWDPGRAARLCEHASAHALASGAPSSEQIRSYVASDAPVRHLAIRSATIIGTPNDAAVIHSVLSPYCEALRVQFVAVAHQLNRLQ